jgi:ribosomal protein S18 acetylase RimI-like enzyme
VGYGLAVADRGYLGLFDLVIVPERRGQGFGRDLALTLTHWGREAGAGVAYLQVREENAPARRLYATLGFEVAYGYHYRIGPAGQAARASA